MNVFNTKTIVGLITDSNSEFQIMKSLETNVSQINVLICDTDFARTEACYLNIHSIKKNLKTSECVMRLMFYDALVEVEISESNYYSLEDLGVMVESLDVIGLLSDGMKPIKSQNLVAHAIAERDGPRVCLFLQKTSQTDGNTYFISF